MASWMVRTGGWTAVYVSLTACAAVWAVSGLSTNRTNNHKHNIQTDSAFDLSLSY